MIAKRPRILCVDDESNLLEGLRRTLRKNFDVHLAQSGTRALEILTRDPGFAVISSDLRMPRMNGIEFLSQARKVAPDSTRILLTGNADLKAATAAVNEGHVFRFLSKPCPPATLLPAFEDAVEQHRLITNERVLLQETLLGSIQMLTELLSLTDPVAFGRASRIRDHAGAIAESLGEPARWEMEMAAMLSQTAYITLPRETLDRIRKPDALTAADHAMIARLPHISDMLVSGIPRIENVREIIRQQAADLGTPDIPLGSRILRAVIDHDQMIEQGVPRETAAEILRSRPHLYDASVLDIIDIEILAEATGDGDQILELTVRELQTGMILLDAVKSPGGLLLVSPGHVVSIGLLERLRNFERNAGVKQPLRVKVPVEEEDDPNEVQTFV